MISGQWLVVSCQWAVARVQWLVISGQWPALQSIFEPLVSAPITDHCSLRYNQAMQVVAQHEPATSETSASGRELSVLVSGCGVYRADRSLFQITGRDRVRWLNGMVSNNVRDLTAGHGVYAFVLNPQGNIRGDLYVFNRGESLVAEIERGQSESLLQILRKYIIMDKVEIEDLGENILAIAGPKSGEVLASLGLSAELGSLQLFDVNWNGSTLTLVRGDNPSSPSYELWVPAEKGESVWNALLQAGAVEVHEETLETFRILSGIPKVGQDIRERTLPQETGQERALNFNKGCYIGQEIVERVRSRGAVHRTFVGFELEGTLPAAGTKVQSEGKDVGEITSVAAQPLKGRRLALGYLRREFLAGAKPLTARGEQVKATTLPFLDLLKT